MGKCIAAVLLLSLVLSPNAFSQSVNATVGGTVQDATGSVITGVSIVATNTGNGVVTTVLTNEVGAYQFASLQPGIYDIRADLAGFQPAAKRFTRRSAASPIEFHPAGGNHRH